LFGNVRKYLPLALGTILLILYFGRTDLRTLYDKALAFPPSLALVIVLMNAACGAIKTLRWKRFLARGGVNVAFGPAFVAVHAAFFMGLVTPGTAGELVRAASLESGHDQGMAILVFEKLCDLGVLAVLVALTVGGFVGGPRILLLAVGTVGVACLVAYYLWARHRGVVLRPLRRVLTKLVNSEGVKGAERVYGLFQGLIASPRVVAASVLYSLSLWTVSLIQVALIYRGLHVRPSWGFVALSYFLPYFVGIVSFVPLGIGAFDLTLRQLAESASTAVPAALGSLVPAFFRLFVTVPLVLFGYGCQAAMTFVRSRGRQPK
jgi:uncharacterized protein (TIRG00374 family)